MLLSLLYVLFLGNLFVFDKNTNIQFTPIHKEIFTEQQLSLPSSIKTDKRNEQRSIHESKETTTKLLDKNKTDFKKLDFCFFVLFCQYFIPKIQNFEVLLPLPIYLYWCKMLI